GRRHLPGGTPLALFRGTSEGGHMRAYSHVATIAATALTVALSGASSYAEQRAAPPQREQHGARPRANEGRIPPAPIGRIDHVAPRVPQRMPNGRIIETQHVDGDRWYGHDAPNDQRFRLTRQWDRGRFDRVGPRYRYEVQRIDDRAHRFWIAGRGGFEVAA